MNSDISLEQWYILIQVSSVLLYKFLSQCGPGLWMMRSEHLWRPSSPGVCDGACTLYNRENITSLKNNQSSTKRKRGCEIGMVIVESWVELSWRILLKDVVEVESSLWVSTEEKTTTRIFDGPSHDLYIHCCSRCFISTFRLSYGLLLICLPSRHGYLVLHLLD